MKIKTHGELLDRIDEERLWRVREISALRNQCLSSTIPDYAQRAIRRSFPPMAYAHWEGFVMRSSDYYLNYVDKQRLRLSELNWPFLSLFLTQKHKKEINSNKSYALEGVCRDINMMADEEVELNYKGVISARSNLNAHTLRVICRSLGFDYIDFESKEKFINEGLLEKRNKIAHGERQIVEMKDIDDIEEKVIELIDQFKGKIEKAASNSEYKIKP